MIVSPVTIAHAPQATTYNSAGTYNYTIPQWATHVDVIVIGGGGGGVQGNGGNGAAGNGGSAGSWNFRTLERGSDIPWATTVLSAVTGDGGVAGAKNNTPGPGTGGQSYVSDGNITILGSGGAPGSGTNGTVGGSPGDVVVGDIVYTGGATAPSGGSRTNGNAPGGGGGGGAGGIFNGQTGGMAGAPGAVYLYAYIKIHPPRTQFTDTLDNSSAFSVFNSGSGIAFSGGEALWNGTTDGQGIAVYNTQATTNNQYASAVVGSYIAGAATGLILHSDVGYSGYYAGAFYNTRVTLMRTSGRWNQNAYTTITDAAATVSSGSLVEFWNIGETFYLAVNGTIYITYTISNPIIDEYHRYQGFGMFRSSFISSARISEWNGGDAVAWGKT